MSVTIECDEKNVVVAYVLGLWNENACKHILHSF